jgi:hypothetical protein
MPLPFVSNPALTFSPPAAQFPRRFGRNGYQRVEAARSAGALGSVRAVGSICAVADILRVANLRGIKDAIAIGVYARLYRDAAVRTGSARRTIER